MGKEMTLFDSSKPQKPAHLQDRFEDRSNLKAVATTPSLSYEGKVWTIAMDGEKRRLIRTNEDGDEEPLSTMRVFILDFNTRRGRAYYEGSYNPDQPGTPICWSDDGIEPAPEVPEPVKEEQTAHKCENCPMAVKGSKISDNGKEITACSQHRMLAVVPAQKPDGPPLRMKIAITSDYDKQSPELEAKHFFAFQQYRKFLQSNGVKHTAEVVTKMKFDPTVAYPKIVFSPDRWTEAEESEQLLELLDSGDVEKVLKGYTPEGPDGHDREEKPETEKPKEEPKKAEKPKEKPEAEKPKEKPKKAEKPKEEPEAKTGEILDGWDEDDDEQLKSVPSDEKKDAAPAADEDEDTSSDSSDELDSILSDWEDDD